MTANVVHPAELERMLQARVDTARAKRLNRGARAAQPPRRRSRFGLATVLAAVGSVVAAGAAFAFIADLTTEASVDRIDDAVYRSFDGDDPTGSGGFDSFVRISSNLTVVKGYNTDGRPLQFQENSSPTFTRSYLLSNLPLVSDPDFAGLFREFQLDINQTAGNAIYSLDEVEVYLTLNPDILSYPFSSTITDSDYAEKVYELDKIGDEPSGQNSIKLNYALSEGSGKRDMILRIDAANFLAGLNEILDKLEITDAQERADYIASCSYLGPPPAGDDCPVHVVLYSQFGDDIDGLAGNDDAYEEWGVKLYDLATKSGMKFNDLDADGVKDAGEPGLPGWTIYVDYNDNSVLDTGEPFDVTDATGSYTIEAIVPGTYKVREVSQTNWVCSFPNAGTETAPVTSTQCWYNETFVEGGELTGNDFGNWATATKEGRKFQDANGDGDDEGGADPGLGGWTINVYADSDGNGVLSSTEFAAGAVGTDTTDAGTGAYSIGSLAPGKYVVCEVQQADWVQTSPAGPDECTGSSTLGQDGWAITLTSGQTDSGNDFGNFQLIDKSGSKYVDDEGDGSIAGDSKYTASWTIRIYKDDGDNALDAGDTVTSTTTNGSGNYAFNNLGPGTYFVCEATASDWIQTFPKTVAGEVIDTCDNIAGNAEFGYKFTASSGEDQTLNDFGNFQLIDKSGFKFNDNDADGAFEPLPNLQNDTKLTGWTVELWKLISGTWTWQATDVTDAAGYSFTNLGPGTYAVCEVTQTNWVQSFPFSGATLPAGESLFNCSTLTPNTAGATFATFGFQFTASSGADQANNNFGNFLVPPGCTLTQGYWKTHSAYGPAAHPDDTWLLITAAMTGADPDVNAGPDTEFFDTGDSWYEVFQLKPKGGNAWVILAHQYMAAVLNQLNGAGDVPGLQDALDDAYLILDAWDGSQSIPKNDDDRAEAITLASFLASYNEGLEGVPHCGEPGFAPTINPLTGLAAGLGWPIGLAMVGGWLLRRRSRKD